jgi:hypothetical protein
MQIIPICVIGAGCDEVGEAVQNGGYRTWCNLGVVTVGQDHDRADRVQGAAAGARLATATCAWAC